MESMLSERGAPLRILEGYKFRRDRPLRVGERWRCTNKKCSAYFILSSEDALLERSTEHNHPLPKNIQRQKISNTVKRKALEDLSARPVKLIRREVMLSGDTDMTETDVVMIRKTITQARRAVLPPLPRSIDDVHAAVESIPVRSSQGENLLLVNDNIHNIMIFSTVLNLRFLARQTRIFIDGTFSHCAKFFFQMFTIHTVSNGHYVPLIFALLPNKTKEAYEKMFIHIRNKMAEIGEAFYPKEIMADFEIGIHIAAKAVWPAANVSGCRFHLCQSWWRKIQDLGLIKEYSSNSESGKLLRWIFGLPFLDPEIAEESFIEDFMSVCPEKLQGFFNYLAEIYMDDTIALFPPAMWASSEESERTTNACESFHAKFKQNFNSPHPNIYMFIEALKEIQVSTYISMNSCGTTKKINSNTSRKIQYLHNLKSDYTNRKISRFQYVKAVSEFNRTTRSIES